MSPPAPSKKPKTGPGWSIHSPASGSDPLPLDNNGNVNVEVDDNHQGNSGYCAGICNANQGLPTFDQCTEMNPPPADSTIWSLTIGAEDAAVYRQNRHLLQRRR